MQTEAQERIINTVGCGNCGGRCIIHAHVKDGNVTRITTETEREAVGVPLTACVKGLNYHKTFLSEDRLKYPMKRVGERGEGKFERISWEEAVDIIASEWKRIKEQYGPASRYVNDSSGQSGLLRGDELARRLLALDGGYIGKYNTYSAACIRQATELMYGTKYAGNSMECILDSKLIILWGHNPVATRYDSVTMYYLRKARDKGIPIYIIDPRRSDTIDVLKASWIPVRPATDPALMDAMAYTIYSHGLADKEFLDKYCVGFDREHMPEGVDKDECYLTYLLGDKDGIVKDCNWAEKITGVPAKTIEELALAYATAKPAAIIEGNGPQRNAYGEQITRGGILLACMTGNIGMSGGSAAGYGYVKLHNAPKMPKVANPFGGSIPVFRFTDAIVMKEPMTALQGVRGVDSLNIGIKMLINIAGNTLINQHSDINRTSEILRDTSKCEFILCSDIFMTASAKFADILLPGTSFLEGDNMVTPWRFETFLGYANKVVEPLYECRFEYDWLREVAERLGLEEEFSEGRSTEDWLRYVYDNLREDEPELPDYDTFKSTGVYKYKNTPSVVAFSDFIKNPDVNPLNTSSGKIEIFSKKVYETEYEAYMPPIPRYVKCPEGYDDELANKYPLQLVGYHTIRRTHSIHDNNKELHKIDPQQVWINPIDAKIRGITDGQEVKVYNDRGALILPAYVTDKIMPGVTAISQGAWYKPDANGVDRGGCINILTSQRPTPYAQGNPQHTNLVEITTDLSIAKNNVGIAILAGGLSSRMGSPKADLMLCRNGENRSFMEHLCKELSEFKYCYISENKNQGYHYEGYREIIDDYDEIGPLGGIYSVLKKADTDAVLFVACDMPHFTADAARHLISKWDGRSVCYSLVNTTKEPMAGIYTRDCIPAIENQIANGNYKLGLLINEMNGQPVNMSDFADCYININTKEEYEELI